jgi:hypothetical protein
MKFSFIKTIMYQPDNGVKNNSENVGKLLAIGLDGGVCSGPVEIILTSIDSVLLPNMI